ncbi:flagellar hook-associated protein FlgL [Diaphorobacter sp. J5-51]|uniref:flagellar hook-associated protein FlgL n=1 Tax=Diaphorobacter sp. J5-51 TaxID=680496 RepID=UPI000642E000|nr:flagellar hook-associated protein FlgL [Diaphorobacter sp. J5-51]KLR59625.1 flagellar hook protein FlgL [Diaphorobacter sp. J5-51]
MSSSFYRVSTANMYDATLRNLSARQKTLVDLQENLTAGKRVVRPSDDPVAAAQAERALTRISRIQTEQRALDVQRNAIAQAESTLGDAVGLVQEIRQLVVAAGGGALKPEDRKTYANQIQSLREQLTQVINRKDTNGVPLLGALGSALEPFAGPLSGATDYKFDGLAGQAASGNTSIPTTVDGHSALMFDPKRDGIYNAAISSTDPAYPQDGRRFGTDAVQVTNAHLLQQPPPTVPPAPPAPPYTYTVAFTGVTLNKNPDGSYDGTYDANYVISSTNPAYTSPGTQSVTGLKADQLATIPVSINDPGGATLKFNISATPTTNPVKLPPDNLVFSPAPGDTVTLSASPSIASAIDAAIRDIGGAANNNAAAQAVGQALANIDAGLERLHNMRGYAGELLNRADRITGDQENRSIQLEADRSRAQDLDMVKGISDFQNASVGYEAALKSYAQVQRLSLFNFIS